MAEHPHSAEDLEGDHENTNDILLAYRTLMLLGILHDKGLLPPDVDVRSLAVNLCVYYCYPYNRN